jgi:CMP-N,N'-diacetyllegionaminic acid synthase
MKTVAFIPARSGSIGIPEKNIKLIAGKPLIAWSIEQAISSELIDEVYISTNSEKIANIGKKYGANVPYLRPQNISGATATTESSVEHFCEFLDQNQLVVENILLIQCTSPVRAYNRFDSAIKYFIRKDFDSLISVSESHRFSWKNLDNPNADYDFTNRPRRQDILKTDKLFVETGSFYLFKKSEFLKSKNRICGKYGLYLTPEEESFDIDSMVDFSICESLLNLKKNIKTFAA